MIDAIINDTSDPQMLAKLAKGRMKSKKEDLEQELHGLVGTHQRKMLAAQLKHIDFLNAEIKELDQEVSERLYPFKVELTLLETIPGVGQRSAETILAEIGSDMDRFSSDAHLSSWAGMSPGSNESAGKRKSGKTRKGNKHLRSTFVQCARSASHSKETYLWAQYRRIAARRGSNRAAVAVGHSILVIVYHILKNRQPYCDLGANYFDERNVDLVLKNAIKRIETLGFTVTVEEKVA